MQQSLPHPSALPNQKSERLVEKVLRNGEKTIYVDLKRNPPNGRHHGFHIRATENAAGGRRSAIVIPLDLAAGFAAVLTELLEKVQDFS